MQGRYEEDTNFVPSYKGLLLTDTDIEEKLFKAGKEYRAKFRMSKKQSEKIKKNIFK